MDRTEVLAGLRALGQDWIDRVKPEPDDAVLLGNILERMAVLTAEKLAGGGRTAELRTCNLALSALRAKYDLKIGMANERAAAEVADRALSIGVKILLAAVA